MSNRKNIPVPIENTRPDSNVGEHRIRINNSHVSIPPIEILVRDYNVPQELANKLVGITEAETADNISLIMGWGRHITDSPDHGFVDPDKMELEKGLDVRRRLARKTIWAENKMSVFRIVKVPQEQRAFIAKRELHIPTARGTIIAGKGDIVINDNTNECEFKIVTPKKFGLNYKIMPTRR